MTGPFPRRSFLSWTALAAASPLLPPAVRAALAADAVEGRARLALQPFDLQAVRLRPGPVLDALDTNRRFLMALDPDRLLHMSYFPHIANVISANFRRPVSPGKRLPARRAGQVPDAAAA
ncbi:MAG: hypothetical protein WAK94_07590 [Steroidobacteraceae bacterium]